MAALRLYPLRFHLTAAAPLRLQGGVTNAFRSALGPALRSLVCESRCLDPASCPDRGACVYAAAFETAEPGRRPPRPFLLRSPAEPSASARDLEVDLHIFDTRPRVVASYVEAMQRIAESGIGSGRVRCRLNRVEQIDSGCDWREECRPFELRLDQRGEADRVVLDFLTPTELKAEGGIAERPEFAVLFARLSRRILALAHCYHPGAAISTKSLDRAALCIHLAQFEGEQRREDRRSTRTGQVHPLGGFVGRAEYEGELGPFLPWLEAGCWTGVGRQTVWGHGHYRILGSA